MDGDLVVAGPMARSAKDLDLVMGLIAAPSAPTGKAWSVKLPPTRKQALKDHKIGLWLDDPAFPTDIKVLDCLQALVDRLAKAGVQIEEKHPNIDFSRSHEVFQLLLRPIMGLGISKEMFKQMMIDSQDLSKDDRSDRACNIRGITQLHRTWMGLDYERTLLRQAWADFFTDFDLLLCPSTSITAFPHDHTEDRFDRKLVVNGDERSYIDTGTAWTGLTGVAYLPSTVAPAGLSEDGLPVGVQIVAPFLEDRTSIHFAELIEDVVGGFIPPPGFD